MMHLVPHWILGDRQRETQEVGTAQWEGGGDSMAGPQTPGSGGSSRVLSAEGGCREQLSTAEMCRGLEGLRVQRGWGDERGCGAPEAISW